MADGWVELRTLKPGELFETRDGRRWYFTGFVDRSHEGADTHEVYAVGSEDVDFLPAWESVRPLEPVAVTPGIDPTLRGLLLRALETGETYALTDYLIERSADPDLTRAVRARTLVDAATECDLWAQDADLTSDNEGSPARRRTARQLASMARHISNAIRRLDTDPIRHGVR